MPLAIGSRLGPYDILSPLGAGGMGEVYRAKDTKLGRDVALKILPASFTNDPERVARFRREAQVLASLNHPHIAQIHGMEEANGTQFLVLELVDGESLDQRIARGKIPVDEALGIAKQIAEALEAAHEKGIIHRDLKPANIALTRDGQVKVLDFGLAKAVDKTGLADRSMSPTVAKPMMLTEAGVILGTVAYMSPEQARGLDIDKRADIWAFGCVLYEMLTRQSAFAAATSSESLAKVLQDEPNWNAMPTSTASSIHELVRRCLQKDRRDRVHDIADARIEIAAALATPAGSGRIPSDGARHAPRLVWAIAIAVLVAVAALVSWRREMIPSSPPGGAHPIEFGVTFPNNFMPTDGVALSPDGRQIAANVWSDSGNIWVHTFDGSQPRPLLGGEKGTRPFWSPDSSSIAFFQGGQIVTMNSRGGPRTVVTKIATAEAVDLTAEQVGGTWSHDNVIVFSAAGKLFRVAAAPGSTAAALAVTGVGGRLQGPTFLPDGRHFLFCAATDTGGMVSVASLDDLRATVLAPTECPGGFAPPNRVLFVRSGSLLAQKLNVRALTLEGDPQVVAANVTRGAVGPWPQLTVSASETGALAFPAPRGGSSLGKLTWFNRQGQAIGTIEPPSADVEYLNPAICPTNDDLVAANRLDPTTGAWHIWLVDAARDNSASRLTSDPSSDFDPAWSVDGKEIIYASDRGGRRAMYRQPVNGGSAALLLDVNQFRYPIPSDWSRDGYVLFSELQRSLWGFHLGDREPIRIQQQNSYAPRISPDGKWIAYAGSDGGTFRLFVERFPGGSPRKVISTGGGTHPRWTNDGRSVTYWIPPGGIVSTDLVLTEQEITVGATRTLVNQSVLTLIDARTHYDITRDGKKILVRQPAGPPTPGIRVLLNWREALSGAVPNA